MKRKICLILLISGLAAGLDCAAQFYVTGSDDPSLRWKRMVAGPWEVIYPENCDSLALSYAQALSKWTSLGVCDIAPSGMRKNIPVILHTRSAFSNGMVSWAPRRMELYTTPDCRPMESGPWSELLTVHEARHAAQMQAGYAKPYRLLSILSGELWNGAVSALYGGPVLLEGDAVAAETAFSSSGRGRSAEFLEYWKACNLDGQRRSWWQWRYSSLGRYTPDYYRAGYVLVAGTMAVYDDADFTRRYYSRISEKVFPFFNLQKTVREASGKSFSKSMREIDDSLSVFWEKQSLTNIPFTKSKLISKGGKRYVSYENLCVSPYGIYALRSGIDEAGSLVRLSAGGDEEKICTFSSNCGRMTYSKNAGRLLWSEVLPDLRWEQQSSSEIRYLDSGGRKKTLVGGRRIYNPSACGDDCRVAAVEYLENGEERVLVLDALDGKELDNWKVPSGMQICEFGWVRGMLFASAVSGDGFGIVSVPGFNYILEPIHASIRSLGGSPDGGLVFTSDRSGSNEVYSLDPRCGKLKRLTSGKVGSKDGVLTEDGLYFTSTAPEGTLVHYSAREELLDEESTWNVGEVWPWADKLGARTRQAGGNSARDRDSTDSGTTPGSEASAGVISRNGIGSAKGITPGAEAAAAVIDGPSPYRKAAKVLNVHSWLPVFVDYDEIASMSFETLQLRSLIGATAFFQNDLGTFYGSAGVRLWQNLRSEDLPFAGGMAKFSYRGLFPVLDAQFDFGSRQSRLSWFVQDADGLQKTYLPSDTPAFSSTLRAYVPLRFSSSGWSRGFTGSVSWNFSNDLESASIACGSPVMNALKPSEPVFTNRLTASARWYSMRPVAASCIYPRLGIGAEAGVRFYPGSSRMHKPLGYLYLYGYLPGLDRIHGLKLTSSMQYQPFSGYSTDRILAIAPRGFLESGGMLELSGPLSGKISADYVLPFAALDWDGFCPVAYVRNLEATLHCDYSYICGGKSPRGYAAAGADMAVHLSNLAWIPYDTRIGLGWNWNFALGKSSLSMIFSIDM